MSKRIILLLLVLVLMAVPANAAESSRRGSIVITYADGAEPVQGAAFTLYRIATSSVDVGTSSIGEKWTPIIKKSDGTPLVVDPAPEASSCADIVTSAYERGRVIGGAVYSGQTGSGGILRIDGIERGMYLAKETSPAPGYLASAPFIFAVPCTVSNNGAKSEISYEVRAEPKPFPTGKLIITKNVSGNAAERDREFTFRVTFDTKGSFPYGRTGGGTGSVRSGDAIKLKGGESAEIRDIPSGTQYAVSEVEAGRDGYTTESTGTSGRITKKTPARALFVNKKYASTDSTPKGGITPGPVKTGDNSQAALYLVLAMGALGSLFILFALRRDNR